MAEELGIKINELGAAQIILGTEFVAIDNGVDTLKATLDQVKEHAIGDNNISALGDGSVTGAILELEQESETADSNIAETMAQNGAHNLLPNNITTEVDRGITWTRNDDGSISLSGTATEDITKYICNSDTSVPSGTYKLAGCPSGGGATYYLVACANNNNVWLAEDDGVGSSSFSYDKSTQNNFSVYIHISSGTNMTGKVIKPMLRLATDPITVYAPYAMTNGELTKRVSNRGLHIPSSADSFAGAASSMFSAVIPLLTNVGDIADGCLEAINYDYFDFTVVKISSTIYRATINQGTRLVTSVYSNGTITSYKYDGTQI